jgi:hypothetical protein
LNLSHQPQHLDKHQQNDNGGKHKNMGEQDVHQGPNGCVGEQARNAANLAESPGLLH